MRDSHRLKEKYELSLDNRQIVTITVASLVVLGGVFMLGVVVGKKLSTEAAAATAQQPPDLLSQLDQKTDALENVKADAALTFQDELTRKTPTLIAEAPVVKPVPAPTPSVVETPKPAEVPIGAVGDEKPVTPEPAVAKLPEMPRPEPVTTRTVDAGGAGLKEAFGKAQKTPEPAGNGIAGDGSWTVQLSAYQDRGEADRFADGLRDKGYAPYIVEANIPGKGTWFRVRMGRFGTKDQATRYMDDFRRETSMAAIVTTTN